MKEREAWVKSCPDYTNIIIPGPGPTKVALSSIFVVQDTIKQFVETRDLSITIITLATSGSDLYPGHGLYIIAATSLLCDDKMH